MNKRLSRREFLELSGGVLGVSAATACAHAISSDTNPIAIAPT